jgi:8-oxo-dGTP pyrophosphatase MutT (NUDIX family)
LRAVRPIAICVFRNGDRILVEEGYDPTKDEVFYRPPGGGIRFGEYSKEALARELMEELGVQITSPRLLGVVENLFTFDGEEGHEVVFVYDAELTDRSLYEKPELWGVESQGAPIRAYWRDIASFGPDAPPLYPQGLLQLLVGDRGV